MKRNILTPTLWGLALVTALAMSTQALAHDLTAADKASLAAGKTVRKPLATSGKNGFYGGTGITLIDAPGDVVWRAVLDWGAYPLIYPKTVSVDEVARRGNARLVHFRMGHRLINIEYHVNVNADPEKYAITFEIAKDRPHDLEYSRGYWRLFPQKDGRTLVVYSVAAQVPMGIVNLLPKELERKIERNLVGAPNDLRKWLMSPKGQKYHAPMANNR